VLVDIPKDVQTALTDVFYAETMDLPGYKPRFEADPTQVANVAELLNRAERPVVLAGRGVNVSQAHEELKELVETMQSPVVHTMLGLGSFPPQHYLDLGMLGMHGTGYANRAIQNADLVLALGTRFGDRATMRTNDFAQNAVVVHVDIDPSEIGKNVAPFASVVGDVKSVLQHLNPLVEPSDRSAWVSQVSQWRTDYPLTFHKPTKKLSAREVIRKVCRNADDETIVVTGVGQHQMFAAQEYCSPRTNGFVSSGGHGTMGFELPAALGAQVACPDEAVWVVAGDGGFQMTMQELSTVVQEGLPVKIAVISNGYLGMVRQWQEMFCNRNYVDVGLHKPDFVKLADAYGIPAMRVDKVEDVAGALERAKAHPGAYLIDFTVEPEENVFPMCAAGTSLNDLIEAPMTAAA